MLPFQKRKHLLSCFRNHSPSDVRLSVELTVASILFVLFRGNFSFVFRNTSWQNQQTHLITLQPLGPPSQHPLEQRSTPLLRWSRGDTAAVRQWLSGIRVNVRTHSELSSLCLAGPEVPSFSSGSPRQCSNPVLSDLLLNQVFPKRCPF